MVSQLSISSMETLKYWDPIYWLFITPMFNRTTVPSVFVTGIIIPILKKSTLDPNIVNNLRPITLGSIHDKLIEFLILPADMAHPNQFGLRKGRGTAMACNYLNDMSFYCKSKGSPLYIHYRQNMEYFVFLRFFAFLWCVQGVSVLEIHFYKQILLLGELICT